MINFAPFISLLLRKNKVSDSVDPNKITENDKKEIEKINEMGLFEAMNYLKEREEKVTYCGACGGDASHCDGC